MANWLRDQINETLSRYDIPSDVYERDVQIDALCVISVDRIATAQAAQIEAYRDSHLHADKQLLHEKARATLEGKA